MSVLRKIIQMNLSYVQHSHKVLFLNLCIKTVLL